MTYAERIMGEMASERASLGIIDGKPLPVEARDRVINRMVPIFIAEALKAKKKPKVSEMTDEDWIISLESEPSLKGINIRQEISKAQFWCKQNKRVATRRFLINWFNKAERVVDLKAMGAQHATGLKPPPPKGPEGWIEWLTTELATISEDHPAYGQLVAARNCKLFHMLPSSWQQKARQAVPA
jgi:hypothetical protein